MRKLTLLTQASWENYEEKLQVGVYKGTNGHTILKHEGFIMDMRMEGTVEIFPLWSDQGLLLLEGYWILYAEATWSKTNEQKYHKKGGKRRQF